MNEAPNLNALGLGQCQHCAFSKIHEQLGQVARYCHGTPPAVVMLPGPQGIQLRSIWPPIDANEVCGMFRLDPAAEPKVMLP